MKKLKESPRIKDIEKKWDKSIETLLHQWHWEDNLMHKEIAARLNIPRPTITRWFKQLRVPSRNCHRITNRNLLNVGPKKGPRAKPKPKKEFPWSFKEDIFEKWSEDMAYLLGFLMSDGYVFINPRGSKYLGFTSTDKEIIEKVRTILKSNHKIGHRKANNIKWKDKYVLQIGSKKTVERLEKFGIVQNKSLIIKFPKDIPDKFLGHFIRGYFDGDGCLCYGLYKSKDRPSKQFRIVASFISGSRQFLRDLHVLLVEKTGIQGGCLTKKNSGFQLSFSSNDSKELYRFMYSGVSKDKFLERKYNKFQEAFRIVGA